jgi:hypothetical protein
MKNARGDRRGHRPRFDLTPRAKSSLLEDVPTRRVTGDLALPAFMPFFTDSTIDVTISAKLARLNTIASGPATAATTAPTMPTPTRRRTRPS